MSVTQAARRSTAAVLVTSCLLAAQCLPQSADAQELSIGIVRDGDVITVRASAGLKANPRIAWEVLTDYDHLAEFIPDIHSSRVLRRDGDGVVVEQKGEFGLNLSSPTYLEEAMTETCVRAGKINWIAKGCRSSSAPVSGDRQ